MVRLALVGPALAVLAGAFAVGPIGCDVAEDSADTESDFRDAPAWCDPLETPTDQTPIDVHLTVGDYFWFQGDLYRLVPQGQTSAGPFPSDLDFGGLPMPRAGEVIGVHNNSNVARLRVVGTDADGGLVTQPQPIIEDVILGLAVGYGGQVLDCMAACSVEKDRCLDSGGTAGCCASNQIACNAECGTSAGFFTPAPGEGNQWCEPGGGDAGDAGDGGGADDSSDGCADPGDVEGALVVVGGELCHYDGPVESVPDGSGGCIDVINTSEGFLHDCVPVGPNPPEEDETPQLCL